MPTPNESQVAIRLTPEMLAEALALVPAHGAAEGIRATRNLVLREALVRGLRALSGHDGPPLVIAHDDGLSEGITLRVSEDVLEAAEELAGLVTPPNRGAVLREAIAIGLRAMRHQADSARFRRPVRVD